MTEGLRAGQVAAAVGVNLQTLRYYERRGLMEEPQRTLGGHRIYPQEAVTLLRVIKTAQNLGFTLDEVADLLDTGVHRHGSRPDPGLQARAYGKIAEIDRKIHDLTVIRESLEHAVTAGCDDLIACAGNPGCPLPFTDLLRHPERTDHGDR
jgi:DNA-binding transcriptional MerR regulator